jgi:hypothetical protein
MCLWNENTKLLLSFFFHQILTIIVWVMNDMLSKSRTNWDVQNDDKYFTFWMITIDRWHNNIFSCHRCFFLSVDYVSSIGRLIENSAIDNNIEKTKIWHRNISTQWIYPSYHYCIIQIGWVGGKRFVPIVNMKKLQNIVLSLTTNPRK